MEIVEAFAPGANVSEVAHHFDGSTGLGVHSQKVRVAAISGKFGNR
jgi:hypothetical protein